MHGLSASRIPSDFLPAVVFVAAVFAYILAAIYSGRRCRPWPLRRTACWCAGVLCAGLATVGPVAEREHLDFTMHMASHLLLGMVAPLFIVLSLPAALTLRTLNVPVARKCSRLLNSRLILFLLHPATAAILDVGGLWALYSTGLYEQMHRSQPVSIAVHAHLFLAGYLFTASIIDSGHGSRHIGFKVRAAVLILAFAGHGILAKRIYVSPPPEIPSHQVKAAAQLMYYGGDAVELLLVVLFCLQWYRASRPGRRRAIAG